jgi:hypothetical protein
MQTLRSVTSDMTDSVELRKQRKWTRDLEHGVSGVSQNLILRHVLYDCETWVSCPYGRT